MSTDPRKLLDDLMSSCFHITEDYGNWDGESDVIPLKAAWGFNECFSLRDDMPALEERVRAYLQDMQIRSAVRDAAELIRGGDVQGGQRRLIDLVVNGTPVEELKAAMLEVDPHHWIWSGSHPIGARVSTGLPLVEGQYEILSDIHGHDVAPPSAEAAAFVDACRQGYEDGTLHGHGHVARDRETGLVLFLVVAPVEDGAPVTPRALADLGADLGVPLRRMALARQPLEQGRDPERPVITAALGSVRLLDRVPAIVRALAAPGAEGPQDAPTGP
ncbi:hypothetical protein LAZ40_09485 [Cereibacter sphaeroides]|uniref:hypothetical protein n=1 Tax=Cereibacter sphaeroides TaxID=1063 RepID=UPI001F1F1773|nr:hypothetical protein [Cereibacter sphaeroides]MCE6959284.1 hypothetical protein [Cereibacter sphaeroides]MCE6972876.1 hypothetical protein [Cereibacter sphaeroides]